MTIPGHSSITQKYRENRKSRDKVIRKYDDFLITLLTTTRRQSLGKSTFKWVWFFWFFLWGGRGYNVPKSGKVNKMKLKVGS